MKHSTRTRAAALLTPENWPLGLLAVLAAIYAALGLSAGPIGILGIVGAIAVVVAVLVASRSRSAASIMLIVGVVPFAVATWWTVTVPLTAILFLSIGLPQVKRLAVQSSLDHGLAT